MAKKVYCLYRVSTKGQVEKDDIPMQKQRCHEFAKEKGWEILKEFSEKGVSGFKVSAKDRDAIQEIQRDAAMGQFDILLVFMFDRLGRKEDETPFIVEWFVQNGIEVWSTEEGQQRFDTHVDKLMNYIRYWQASGESLKTSIRTKTRLGQIVQEGHHKGGTPAYGYQLVKKGRIGKKNRELYDIEISPEESPTIKEMYDLADKFGYGGRRISTELKAKGIMNLRTGEPFHYSTIQRILRNPMYTGILRSGDSRSEVIPELQIIMPEQFDRVQNQCQQRSVDYEKYFIDGSQEEIALQNGDEIVVTRPPRNIPKRNTGKTLLSGNIFCGHCGGRIFASTARKSHHSTAPETFERVPIYKCYNRTQHKEVCDGPTTYRAGYVDQVVENLIRGILERSKSINEKDFVNKQVQVSAAQYQQKQRKAKADYLKATKELSKWEALMLDSIEGTCVFTPEQIKKRMDAVQTTLDDLTQQISSFQEQAETSAKLAKELAEQHQNLLSWAGLFDSSSPQEKRMIAAQIVKAVTLTRGYGIEVEFNISEAQYLGGMEMG
ncbi:MAG: recombinase family protein [Oscillibacter sp.]|nr:recombinase family protein [Oscillibacter sp.]